MSASRSLLGLALILPAVAAVAQLGEPTVEPIVGARNPALSPDGKRLAFTYLGDVWVAPSEGGRAVPVTNHIEMDDNALWSPDGRWIAFTSNRNGGTDVYVVPSDGGQTRRMTWFPGGDTATDWTPDGKSLVLTGSRESGENGVYLLDVATTGITRLFADQMSLGNARVSPDGGSVLYNRLGFPWSRPRYAGSAAAQLMLFNRTSGTRSTIRSNGFQHLWPRFGPTGRIYTVTVGEATPSSSPLGKSIGRVSDSPARTPNVYEVRGDGTAKRLTEFVGGGVRFLSAARDTGDLAFEYEGDLFRMGPDGGEPQKLALTATTDDKVSNEERLVLTGGADQVVASPDGSTLAFVDQFELWTVPVKQGKKPNDADATRLTDWAGLDRDPVWHPKGEAIFFTSDRDGAERLYRMDVKSREVTRLTEADRDVLELQITPDGDHISYWMSGPNGGLMKQKLDGGEPEKVVDFPRQFRWETDTSYSWSPNGRYVAYTRRDPGSGTNIYIVDLVSKTEANVTRLASDHGAPAFSADGRFLYFVGNRNDAGIYRVALRPEELRAPDEELKYEKPERTPADEIDFTDIDLRIRKVASANPFGTGNLRFDAKTGDLLYTEGGQITKLSYNGEETKKLTSGAGVPGFEFTADGDKLVFVQGGELKLLNLRAPNNPVETVKFRAEYLRDLRAVRKAAFQQFWREYNRGFYDGNFHGRDWTAIRGRYQRLLEGVGHRNEFATILNMMVGELEASHAEVGPAGGNPGAPSFGHPGFTFDYSYQGPGIKVLDVPARSPGSFAKTQIKPGEYVLAINGKDVSLNESLWREALIGQNERDLTLLVNDKPSKEGAREVRYRAMGGGEWGQLLYRNRIDQRRKYVEQRSGGRLAYIHIPGMGGGNLDQFNLEAWEQIRGKKGAIIDVRNNGGGNISESLIDLIERRPTHWWLLRDSVPNYSPDYSWDLPTVVMMAETSFSNAEMFPYSMRQRGFASLVGKPTPGYVIGTYGLGLVDGTSARMPTWGVFRLDGTNLENNGEKPDYDVDFPAEEYFAGRDPQLEKAIEVALSKLK